MYFYKIITHQKLLIKKNNIINIKDYDINTSPQWGSFEDSINKKSIRQKVINYLLQLGTNPNLRDNYGNIAYDLN